MHMMFFINQSPLVQPVVPKEPRKISPRFIIYIAGIKGKCMCVYQSLRKIQLFNKFWAIIFQFCFNWKNRITLNNDCIHRRQLAWFVGGELPAWPSNRLVLRGLHGSSRRRPRERVWSRRLFRDLFHQPADPLLLLFGRVR